MFILELTGLLMHYGRVISDAQLEHALVAVLLAVLPRRRILLIEVRNELPALSSPLGISGDPSCRASGPQSVFP